MAKEITPHGTEPACHAWQTGAFTSRLHSWCNTIEQSRLFGTTAHYAVRICASLSTQTRQQRSTNTQIFVFYLTKFNFLISPADALCYKRQSKTEWNKFNRKKEKNSNFHKIDRTKHPISGLSQITIVAQLARNRVFDCHRKGYGK